MLWKVKKQISFITVWKVWYLSNLSDAWIQEGFRRLHADKMGCQAFVCFIPYWSQSANEIVWRAVPRGTYKGWPEASFVVKHYGLKYEQVKSSIFLIQISHSWGVRLRPVWRRPTCIPASLRCIPTLVSRPAIFFAAIREWRVALIVVPTTISVRIDCGQITWKARHYLPIIAGTNSDISAVNPRTALVQRRSPARHRFVGAVADNWGSESRGQHKHQWEYQNKFFHSHSLSRYILFVLCIQTEKALLFDGSEYKEVLSRVKRYFPSWRTLPVDDCSCSIYHEWKWNEKEWWIGKRNSSFLLARLESLSTSCW